jgi:uncharacterized protein (TIGR02268 family)
LFLPRFVHAVALASLLVGMTAAGQPAPVSRALPRSVVLTGRPGEPPEVRVAPGFSTLLRFDARMIRESVEVEGRARFAIVDPGDQTLTLEPAVALGPQERVVVRVTFREGAPASAMFVLVPPTSEVDTLISVSRPPQSVAACQAEWVATHERCEALARELEAPSRAASPAALVLAGLLDAGGMRGRSLLGCDESKGDLRTKDCVRLRASEWAVVALTVRNAGKETWAPVKAELRPTAGGEPRTVRALLPLQATIAPGAAVRVAVEVEMPRRKWETWLTESHALTVCDAAGLCLSFVNVEL